MAMARLRRSSASFLISWVEEALSSIRWPSLASQMHARSDGHGAAPSKAEGAVRAAVLGLLGLSGSGCIRAPPHEGHRLGLAAVHAAAA